MAETSASTVLGECEHEGGTFGLLSILRANGSAAVEIEGRVNIVPVNDIRTYPLPTVQALRRERG